MRLTKLQSIGYASIFPEFYMTYILYNDFD